MSELQVGTSTDQGTSAVIKRGWVTMEDGTKVRTKSITITPKGTTKSVIDRNKYNQYTQHDAKTAKGSKRIDNNDTTAEQLRACEWHSEEEDGFALGAELLTEYGSPTTASDLWTKYAKLNAGMRRMNIGNRVRGAMNRQARALAKAEATAEAK